MTPGLFAFAAGVVVGCGPPPPAPPPDGTAGTEKSSGVDGIQKLIDEIPKDAQPRSAENADVQRNRANRWLKDNAVGKSLTLAGTVAWVKVVPQEDQNEIRYFVLGKWLYTDADLTDAGLVGRVRSGGDDWNAVVMLRINWVYRPEKNDNSQSVKKLVGDGAAKRLEGLKGKSVRVGGVISSAKFAHQGRFDETTRSWPRAPELQITLETVTVDGIDPRREK
jgi:hypothetical protein